MRVRKVKEYKFLGMTEKYRHNDKTHLIDCKEYNCCIDTNLKHNEKKFSGEILNKNAVMQGDLVMEKQEFCNIKFDVFNLRLKETSLALFGR